MTIEVKSKLALLINKFSYFLRYFLSLFQIRIETLKRNVFTVLVLLLIFINKDVKVSLFCYTSDFYSFKIKKLSVYCVERWRVWQQSHVAVIRRTAKMTRVVPRCKNAAKVYTTILC